MDVARTKANHAAVTGVGMDETAARRGHDYVSLVVDMKERKVLFVTPGKDSSTVEAFVEDLKAHQGDPKAITEVSIDMSPAYIKGVTIGNPDTIIADWLTYLNGPLNEVSANAARLNLHTGSRVNRPTGWASSPSPPAD